jgi:hypothetical protein
MNRRREGYAQQPAAVVFDLAPHFPGYFGEHISEYPAGTQQLSGPLLYRPSKNQGMFFFFAEHQHNL